MELLGLGATGPAHLHLLLVIAKLLSKVRIPAHRPEYTRVPVFATSSVISVIVKFHPPIWYLWHDVSCSNLHFPDHQWSWASFHICIGFYNFSCEWLLIFLSSDCFYFYKIKSCKVISWEWKAMGWKAWREGRDMGSVSCLSLASQKADQRQGCQSM